MLVQVYIQSRVPKRGLNLESVDELQEKIQEEYLDKRNYHTHPLSV